MKKTLNIHTALSNAHVSISDNGELIAYKTCDAQKDHAGFVQTAIRELLDESNISLNDISAVATTIGPGSYTGLRVGLASAKGLCYALDIPLIGINTLELLAFSLINNNLVDKNTLLIPMIDARRMEVFTTIYNYQLETIMPPCNLVLDENSYKKNCEGISVAFVGDAIEKWEKICTIDNAKFYKIWQIEEAFGKLSAKKMNENFFIDNAYAEPLYIKDFYVNHTQ